MERTVGTVLRNGKRTAWTVLRKGKTLLQSLLAPAQPAPDTIAFPEGPLPDWRRLIDRSRDMWTRAVAEAAGPRVLIGTYIGGHPQMTVIESALAVALTLRGARVDTLLCDEQLPGCTRAKIAAITPEDLGRYRLPDVMCKGCVHRGEVIFEPLGLPLHRVGASLSPGDADEARGVSGTLPVGEIAGYRLNGWPIGEHAVAGALRYFGRGDLDDTPGGEVVLRRYLEASIRSARSLQSLIRSRGYGVAVINHGIYVPHGIAAAVCRDAQVRVATWNIAYRKQCVIFSHDDTYHHTLMAEPRSEWEGLNLGGGRGDAIMRYLRSRERGNRDWIWFNKQPDEDTDAFARRTGLDWSRPVIGMLTNVIWDAQLHYPANAFPNMLTWVLRTIAYFQQRPDLQLLIRVHPGELAPTKGSTKSGQPLVAEIERAFPTLPANVFIIPPESTVSTYAAMERCDTVIIYGTKTGVELTSRGIPVVVAGEAWIRNKGLTRDAESADDYFAILDTLPQRQRMEPDAVRRAQRYAYHFFFRRMIPLPFLQPVEGWPPYVVSLRSLDELRPGVHPGLDVICDGILRGTPFSYPAERFGVHDA
jgi:hypothetical protein